MYQKNLIITAEENILRALHKNKNEIPKIKEK